jgi:adenine-specific DNA methylase
MRATEGRKGKSAHCPFCDHIHPLDAVKTKGFADQYEDAPLIAADLSTVQVPTSNGKTRRVERKIFRPLTALEVDTAIGVDVSSLTPFGNLPAAPSELIAPGNKDSVRGTGYGRTTWASLMNDRQILQFTEMVRAIRGCYQDVLEAGASPEYAQALAGYAASNLVRRLRRATRGVTLQAHGSTNGTAQNRNQTTDLFKDESMVAFNFDWFETGPGDGPGTWRSLTSTTLTPLCTHVAGLTKLAAPGRFRRASATNLPYRDATIDAVVVDPPYYSMIDYADVSDLFYVWLRRCLFDVIPDLFANAGDELGLQDKSQEIIVKRGATRDDPRTTNWYERQLSAAFAEMRRVLKTRGTLTVVFGHSDPDAWRRLLGGLRDAGFVVTSAWPARTESGATGVASIKVTVTIGCRVAPEGRRASTAAQVEREIAELIRKRVGQWDDWGLALSDQLMASYGPAMQCVGRYRVIQRPDGTEPDLDHFLAIGRRSVIEAHAFKVDELPLDTFDPQTRFAIFWLRAFGTAAVNKGESVFHAQSSQLRMDDVRPKILEETKNGFSLTLKPPASVDDRSSVIEVVRALGAGWASDGTEGAAQAVIASGSPPDDAHLWATVGELVSQLPDSDRFAVALTACQRNRRAIETEVRHGTPAMVHQDELSFDETGTS